MTEDTDATTSSSSAEADASSTVEASAGHESEGSSVGVAVPPVIPLVDRAAFALAQGEKIAYSVTVPGDGIARHLALRLAPASTLALLVTIHAEGDSDLIAEGVPLAAGEPATLWLSITAGTTIDIEFSAEAAGSHGGATLELEMIPERDVYEPNEELALASPAVLGERIEGQLFRRRGEDNEPVYDWFRVELEALPLQVTFHHIPGGHRIFVSLHDAAGNEIEGRRTDDGATEDVFTTTARQGVHYIGLHYKQHGPPVFATTAGEPPAHVSETYAFTITQSTLEPP